MAADGDEILETDASDSVLDEVVAAEMGDAMAAAFRQHRHAEEARYRAAHPDEGLRERKRRLTRRLISDAATTLFATQGFDAVKVSDVAERVGVSEKTIYNYFPTKESMVLDDADEMVESLARALREREPGTSITNAIIATMQADELQVDDAFAAYVPIFVDMMDNTPSLHAAWLEVHERLARVASDELAAQAGVDPRDPEPVAAGRALVGLVEVATQSTVRQIEAGLRGPDLRDAVGVDLRRAARLLETGLWSLQLSTIGRRRAQAQDAARAAEEAHTQVMQALREARAAWEDARLQGRDAGREAREAMLEAQHHLRDAGQQAREAGRQAREAGRRAREAGRQAREAGRQAQQAARETRPRKSS